MPFRKYTSEDDFYSFIGSAGCSVPIRVLKGCRPQEQLEQLPEQDPDEQAHEPSIDQAPRNPL
jgi:hypothetical protein